jgi:hypothetical protein
MILRMVGDMSGDVLSGDSADANLPVDYIPGPHQGR